MCDVVEEIEGRQLEAVAAPVRYRPGTFFEWHTDNASDKYHRRVWTAVVELRSAPGARLEVEAVPVQLRPGDLVLFPSQWRHRATAPESGERLALVMWFSEAE